MDYYCNKHIPLVGGLLGDSVKGAAVRKGLGGAAPNSSDVFVAMGNLFFDNMESFETSFGPNAKIIMADLPNYTNVEPVVQVSELVI
jgi:uncharacterized protein (TIGR02118 family)